MKKILYILSCLFTLTILTNKVYASSFSLTLDGDTEFSNEITLNLHVSSLTGFSDGLYGLEAVLDYDKTKLELVSIDGLTNFDIVYDETKSDIFVTYRETGALVGSDILTLKFKKLNLSDNETTNIKLTNIVASDGDADISGANVSKTIKYVKPAYIKGDLNGNEKIDLPDIIIALKKYLGLEETTSLELEIADMDNDGKLTLKDIISLLKVYLGIN